MVTDSIIIAETDQRSMYTLAEVLSAHIPRVAIDTCTTVKQLIRKLEGASYDAVAVNPSLLHTYPVITDKLSLHQNVPLLVTVSQKDFPLAHTAFAGTAFDFIVKPIVPLDSVHTFRLALWHNKLQRLLALKERAAARVRHHSKGSPGDRKAEEELVRTLETTYQTITTSFRLLLNIQQNSSLMDVAASVERRARHLALDRLINLYKEGTTH